MSQNIPNEMQQRNYILQLLGDQQGILDNQLGMLQENHNGIEITIRTLKGIKENGNNLDQEVIVPLGPNAYTMAKITNPNKILQYIRSDTVIEKTLDQAIESLEKMSENNLGVQEKLRKRLEEINSQIVQVSQSMQGQNPAGQ